MTTSTDLLKLGLGANALFSLATGLLLAIAPATVGSWLGVEIDGWLRLFGIALVGHFFLLAAILAGSLPLTLAKLNLAMVAPYPLLLVGLIFGGVIDRTLGQGLALVDAAVVGFSALLQFRGLRNQEELVQPAVL